MVSWNFCIAWLVSASVLGHLMKSLSLLIKAEQSSSLTFMAIHRPIPRISWQMCFKKIDAFPSIGRSQTDFWFPYTAIFDYCCPVCDVCDSMRLNPETPKIVLPSSEQNLVIKSVRFLFWTHMGGKTWFLIVKSTRLLCLSSLSVILLQCMFTTCLTNIWFGCSLNNSSSLPENKLLRYSSVDLLL